MYNTSHIDAVQPCSAAWLCVQWQAFQGRASHKLWVCLSFENPITTPFVLLLNHSIGHAWIPTGAIAEGTPEMLTVKGSLE